MKNIFDWNRISQNLTKDQINKLKSYYKCYHKKIVGVIREHLNITRD